jgi:hypothetical protein
MYQTYENNKDGFVIFISGRKCHFYLFPRRNINKRKNLTDENASQNSEKINKIIGINRASLIPHHFFIFFILTSAT